MSDRIRVSDLIAPAFLAIHRDIKRGGHAEYWLKGGRGSTKSSFAATEIILGILRDPMANAIVYRKVAATLRESVYEELTKVILRMGLEPWFRFRLSPLQITYKPTGQKILFRGADDPAKSKSIALSRGYFGFLWFEELSEFAGVEDIRTIRASVIRGAGSGRAAVLCSYNPPATSAAWVNAESLVPKPGRLVHASSYLDVPAEWLGEAFLAEAEALKAVDERAYRHMYLGEVTGTGGQVFDNLAIRPITDAETASFGATYAGLDWGWFPDPAHFARCAYFPAQRRLYVYDELRTVRTANRDLARLLIDRKGVTPGEEIIADSAELKSIADMRDEGLRVIGATKGPGSVAAGTKWLQSLREIVIDPERCPETAREFATYEYERTREGTYVDAYPDKDNHSIDAVRYALNRVWMRRDL